MKCLDQQLIDKLHNTTKLDQARNHHSGKLEEAGKKLANLRKLLANRKLPA